MLLLNKQAFTLLEALFGIFILCIITLFFSQLLMVVNTTDFNFYNYKQTIISSLQTQKDFLTTKEVIVEEDKLLLEMYDGNTVSYQLQDEKIIRQKNGQGHQIVLYDVEAVNVEQNENSLLIYIKYEELADELVMFISL